MANRDISESLNNATSDNSVKEFTMNQKFYNPLCLTGYLTPLQRKKLREKRNCLSSDISDANKLINVKKSCAIKRRKQLFNVSSKSKKRLKRKRDRVLVQCTAAKIILRPASINENSKKFFKASSQNRLEKANFTMPLVFKKNVFLNIDKCVKTSICYSRKLSLNVENSNNDAKPSCLILDKENCQSILKTCAAEDLKIYSSVRNESFNEFSDFPKEKSVFDFDWPSDELLLQRQEKARAVVRKGNSLKESKFSEKLNDMEKDTQGVHDKPVKFYPIFHMAKKKQVNSYQDVKSKSKTGTRKILDASRKGEQLIIDAGQKEIGAKICRTCNMIYTIGQEEDEKLHSNYHNMYLVNLKFPGWKKENVIGEYGDGRVIMVRKYDKNVKMKKIEDILIVANRDLGFPSSAIPSKPDLTFVLFISSGKQVVGCVIAEPISSACQVLLANSESNFEEHLSNQKGNTWRIGNWYSSSETVPAICGINRIWVAHGFRRKKVASRMVDCLRCNFIHGHIIGIRELAFTDPSPDGREFAASYTGTNNFLVYK